MECTLGSDDVEDNHHDDHLVGGGGGTVDSAGGGASPDLEPKIPRISCKIPTASIYKGAGAFHSAGQSKEG